MIRFFDAVHPWSLFRMGLSLLVSLLLVGPAEAAEEEESIVILISLDGVRHDYLDRADFPAFGRMEVEGLRADRLVPVFPSSTFANHVSLATGASVETHGIINNAFIDRDKGLYFYGAGEGEGGEPRDWLQAEPLWVAAERQGLHSAVYFWVGSESDYRGQRPSYVRRPFDADIPDSAKVDQILEWLDLPRAERPRLIMSWWHGADSEGHTKGPNHPDIVKQLHRQDLLLARLLTEIDARAGWGHITLILVSDHGMTEATHFIPVRVSLANADIAARIIPGAATTQIYLDDPDQLNAALDVLRGIRDVEVHTPQTLPEELHINHPTRTGDIVLLTQPPHYFYELKWYEKAGIFLGGLFLDWSFGMHGYSPDHPDMSGILLAKGRGVAADTRLGAISNLDIAPTVARLLGMGPPSDCEGVPIGEIGSALSP